MLHSINGCFYQVKCAPSIRISKYKRNIAFFKWFQVAHPFCTFFVRISSKNGKYNRNLLKNILNALIYSLVEGFL